MKVISKSDLTKLHLDLRTILHELCPWGLNKEGMAEGPKIWGDKGAVVIKGHLKEKVLFQ